MTIVPSHDTYPATGRQPPEAKLITTRQLDIKLVRVMYVISDLSISCSPKPTVPGSNQSWFH
jgi:hypothetical protein